MEDQLTRELMEDFKQERLNQLWKRYGDWVIGVSVAIVLAASVHAGWRYWQSHLDAKYNSQFVAAVDAEGEARTKALALLAQEAKGRSHGVLAALMLAAETKDTKQALEYYTMAAEGEEGIAHIARVLAIHRAADAGLTLSKELGEAPSEDMFMPLAKEAAAWLALSQGKKEEARQTFEALKNDETAASSLRIRTGMAASVLGGK